MVIADLDRQRGEDVAATLGADTLFQRTNVADPRQVGRLVAIAIEKYGGLHIMVNNAGIAGTMRERFLDLADFQRIMAVNVFGVMVGTLDAARHMAANGGGSIVNLASIGGIQAGGGVMTYRASKAAVMQFTECAAIELGHYDIRVNAIAPGNIPTPMLASSVREKSAEEIQRFEQANARRCAQTVRQSVRAQPATSLRPSCISPLTVLDTSPGRCFARRWRHRRRQANSGVAPLRMARLRLVSGGCQTPAEVGTAERVVEQVADPRFEIGQVIECCTGRAFEGSGWIVAIAQTQAADPTEQGFVDCALCVVHRVPGLVTVVVGKAVGQDDQQVPFGAALPLKHGGRVPNHGTEPRVPPGLDGADSGAEACGPSFPEMLEASASDERSAASVEAHRGRARAETMEGVDGGCCDGGVLGEHGAAGTFSCRPRCVEEDEDGEIASSQPAIDPDPISGVSPDGTVNPVPDHRIEVKVLAGRLPAPGLGTQPNPRKLPAKPAIRQRDPG